MSASPLVTVKAINSNIKTQPGDAALVGIELQCGNCGDLGYINVNTAEEAQARAAWCPVCEDDQDPAPALARFKELAP